MKFLPVLNLPLIGLFFSGCAGFEREWKQVLAEHRVNPVAAPAGPWEGTWVTTTDGHSGKLRAIVTPAPEDPGKYDFHYHATWARVFSGAYKVRFPVTRERGRYIANGKEAMGKFGTFGHKAVITEDAFEATFSSDKGDLGSFSLARPR
jgi:hypothetical protein